MVRSDSSPPDSSSGVLTFDWRMRVRRLSARVWWKFRIIIELTLKTVVGRTADATDRRMNDSVMLPCAYVTD
jgi:hypothetical protein